MANYTNKHLHKTIRYGVHSGANLPQVLAKWHQGTTVAVTLPLVQQVAQGLGVSQQAAQQVYNRLAGMRTTIALLQIALYRQHNK